MTVDQPAQANPAESEQTEIKKVVIKTAVRVRSSKNRYGPARLS